MLLEQKAHLHWLSKVVCGILFFLIAPGSSVDAAVNISRGQFSRAASTDQSYTVTKTADTNDGKCNSDCSLREAIVAANANAGLNTITLPTGVYSLTLTGANEDAAATGDLDLRGRLIIQGAGTGTTILDGAGNDRVLHLLTPDAALTLRDVTIRNGKAAMGGGIYSNGNLTLEQVLIDGNQAEQNGGGLACVDSTANLIVSDSVVSRNQAHSNQLFQGAGGGIYLSRCGTLTLTRTTFRANAAQNGGGIYLNESGFAISQSSVISNTTRQNGAGVFVGSAAGGEIRNSTISGNQANGSGGGIYVGGDGSATLVNLTIANNHADQDQSGDGDGGGLVSRGLFYLSHSILAGNVDGGGEMPECFLFNTDAGQSQGYNLIQNSTGCVITPTVSSDIMGVDPKLGPLQNNGGPTLTHLPAASSPVVDVVPTVNCGATVDQRGVPRPQDGNHDGSAVCDMGAMEAEPTTGGGKECDFIASDEASLRRAIACVNAASAGTYTLTLIADISYTQPISTIRNISISNLLIQGANHTLNAQGHGRVLALDNVQNATLLDLTLTGGNVAGDSLSSNGGGLSLNCSNNRVDAQSVCTWTLRNTVVINNQADAGGGIDYRCDYHGGGALIVEDSAIRHNQATNAGGGLFYSSDEESGICAVTLRNTLVQGNRAVDGGGLRILRPRVTIIDSTIGDNIASANGGGIMARISDGFITITMRGSTISGNQAGVSGGGLYIASPDQTFDIQLVNSTISSNTVASGAGGGLYLGEASGSLQVTLINSTVAQNRADQGAGVHIFHQQSTSALTGTLRLNNSIIADNVGSDCADEAEVGVVFTGKRVTSFGHNLDSDGSCLTSDTVQASDLVSGTANLGPLADNGAPSGHPTQSHALLPGSDALDAGNDATCAAAPVGGVDQRGVVRPQGVHCDIGAFEATVVTTATRHVFVSSTSSGKVGEVRFRDEDILRYEPASAGWALIFDGSDVGITDDVDAFAFQDDGGLLLSLSNPVTITGLGLVDDSDIVHFVAATLGVTTTGAFTWYLDGSDVGLSEEAEDIDAIDFAPDGRLLVSVSNNPFDANGVTGYDEDLFALNDARFGAESSGVWEFYLDGSAVAISTGRDINGLWTDPANGDLYLSTNGPYTVTGLSGDQDDIFVCTPTALGAASACTFHLFWEGDASGFGNERLDGIDIGATPASFNPTPSAITAADSAAAEPEEEDAQDDEGGTTPIFLPLIRQATP